MNTVTINGKTYTGTSSISVRNNTVIIDGKKVDHGEGGVHNAYALMLSTELEKMIRKEAPKVIEKGEV